MTSSFRVGERVVVVPSCPIESEGVAPGAGDEGEILAPPRGEDARRCWTVRFDRHGVPWSIPERFLSTTARWA